MTTTLKKLKVLWGVKKGDESWMEQIISTNEAAFEDAKKWGINNGFESFRISIDDGSMPNFKNTVKSL